MIVGFGPGTATAVAEKFGGEGFSVALIARNEEKLKAGVAALKAEGVSAFAFRADASDPDSIRGAIQAVRSQAGPITILHWNAYTTDAGDLLNADNAALRGVFDVAVFGLLAAVEEALPDLKQSGDGALLVSNGGLGEVSPEVDQASVQMNVMGLALSNAAKHKLVGLLAARLKSEGVYVGEVMVYSVIKGTSWDSGADSVDPKAIAEKYWELYRGRSEIRAAIK